MKKREIVRKVSEVFSWCWLIWLNVKFFLGIATTMDMVCMTIGNLIYVGILSCELVVKIIQKVNEYRTYKVLVKGFEYLQAVHQTRYKLYFTGEREKIEKYSAEIEKYGNNMLFVGKTAISNKIFTGKHLKIVEEIIRQTEKLMTNERGL